MRFFDQEPLTTIQKALAQQLEVPLDWLDSFTRETEFVQLLTQAVEAAGSPVVLFSDQFEQWFVHYKRSEEREPLLQGLKEWYSKREAPNVKIVISIRSDLSYRLNELQQALGYSLGPQDIFELKKFTSQQATQVRWSITNPLDKHLGNINDDIAAKVAVVIAKEGRWQYAFKLVQEHIKDSEDQQSFLSEFSRVVTRDNTNQAQAQLKKALALAERCCCRTC